MRRDFSTPPPRKSKKKLFIIGFIGLTTVGWFFTHGLTLLNPIEKGVSTIVKNTQPPFPEIPTQNLTAPQRKILALTQQEYKKVPKSYDATVLKYTDGVHESWCADFISWIYLKADIPLANPNSNYWRIPGVLTLQQYYRDAGAYVEATTEYTPKLGDIVFYIGAQTPDNLSDEHVALVLKVEGDVITTIGGNEGDGIMRIRSESPQKSLVGFGRLDS